MAKTTVPPGLKAYAGRFASLGGKARAKKLTAKQRSEIATHAVMTRWAKTKKLKKGKGQYGEI